MNAIISVRPVVSTPFVVVARSFGCLNGIYVDEVGEDESY